MPLRLTEAEYAAMTAKKGKLKTRDLTSSEQRALLSGHLFSDGRSGEGYRVYPFGYKVIVDPTPPAIPFVIEGDPSAERVALHMKEMK